MRLIAQNTHSSVNKISLAPTHQSETVSNEVDVFKSKYKHLTLSFVSSKLNLKSPNILIYISLVSFFEAETMLKVSKEAVV